MDKLAVEKGWTDILRSECLKVMEGLWKGIQREKQMWFQKSRVNWIKEDDRNSRFFHCIANGKRRMNYIRDISFNGIRCSDPTDIRNGVLNFFKNHFDTESWSRSTIKKGVLKLLSLEEKVAFEGDLTKE
ncbi:hypothetical protein Dsin_032152 [Dipteronia sinensis]|uniref:Uncharacterized protein n=1 Tax=Dipteronia sinensis TaxID=43782 RepID=A0AAD9ZMD6_9ROSI|nr:hypothetical protein Dsin_032152 [Dipteronia sinensis]